MRRLGKHTGRLKKKRKNSLTQQNDHTSINFLAIWLKFYMEVEMIFIKLFHKSPSENHYKMFAMKFLYLMRIEE